MDDSSSLYMHHNYTNRPFKSNTVTRMLFQTARPSSRTRHSLNVSFPLKPPFYQQNEAATNRPRFHHSNRAYWHPVVELNNGSLISDLPGLYARLYWESTGLQPTSPNCAPPPYPPLGQRLHVRSSNFLSYPIALLLQFDGG
jgi:hypothetical protein